MNSSKLRSFMTLATSLTLLSVALPSIAEEDTIDVSAVETVAVEAPDYDPIQAFMNQSTSNVRGRPAINFKQLRSTEVSYFQSYEDYLVSIDSENLSADDRLAYLLNLQNFLVVKAVTLDTKKTNLKSLRGTATKPGKLWTRERVTLGGQAYSIADIEAKIVSEFKDPNIVYGLYQGVKGGPCLSSKPYEGATVTARLAELGQQYVNSRGIVDPDKSVVTLTPVYDWNKAALFSGSDKEILAHIKSHASTNLRGRLNRATEVKYTTLSYVIDNYVPEKQVKRRSANPPRQAPAPRPAPSGGSYGS